jgi:hypothetical protein
MNHDEWVNACTLTDIDQYGHVICQAADTRAAVENYCNCGGEVINTWTDNGHTFRSVRYFSPYDEYNRFTYRQWSAGDPWVAKSKDWRLGSTCCFQTDRSPTK